MSLTASRPGRALRLIVVCWAILATFGFVQPVTAQTDSPANAAEAVRSALFDAQSALFGDDLAAASVNVERANSAAAPLVGAFPAGSAPAESLTAGFADAAAAAQSGDAAALAFARSEIWTAILAGAFGRTQAAISAGDVAGAKSWLLLREFRPSTKSRPDGNATLALRDLEQGTITVDVALAEVRADLLDTYQANLDTAIADATEGVASNLPIRAAESAGLVSGYWAILAESYQTQFGVDQRAVADQTVASFTTAIASADQSEIDQAMSLLTATVNGFRAAPLTEDEQARRAGQLLLYLSLIPVEYGRGVNSGQVISDLEIQEAQTFLEGATAAFNDLRMTLNALDPNTVVSVAAALDGLASDIRNAQMREAVAPANEVENLADTAATSLKATFPEEWTRPGGDADFDVIGSLLDEMETAVAAKRYPQAESARLEAYAIFEAGPEKRLMAFSPSLKQQVEALFWQGTNDHQGLATLIDHNASSNEIRRTRGELDKVLVSSQMTLGAGRPSDGAIIVNSATIVFREGLEAILILASLMASMTGINARLKKPVAAGAVAALVASAAFFFLARSLLFSLNHYGEKLEAIVSLFAIGILLLVLNWFFHKVYWTRWIAGHQARKRAIVGGAAGQVIGLLLLGFTSVFREGGETALFLQALVLDAGTAVVIEGVMLGMAGVAIVGVLVFALQKKLPHKKMLIVTGVMISVVLVVMVGHTVHVMQVVGWAPITPIWSVQLPFWTGVWLGLFATWEGLIAQLAALIFVIGSYYAAEMQHDRALAKIPRATPAMTS